jgi:hypothetical protein
MAIRPDPHFQSLYKFSRGFFKLQPYPQLRTDPSAISDRACQVRGFLFHPKLIAVMLEIIDLSFRRVTAFHQLTAH